MSVKQRPDGRLKMTALGIHSSDGGDSACQFRALTSLARARTWPSASIGHFGRFGLVQSRHAIGL